MPSLEALPQAWFDHMGRERARRRVLLKDRTKAHFGPYSENDEGKCGRFSREASLADSLKGDVGEKVQGGGNLRGVEARQSAARWGKDSRKRAAAPDPKRLGDFRPNNLGKSDVAKSASRVDSCAQSNTFGKIGHENRN